MRGQGMNRAADWLKMAERDLGLAEVAAREGYHEGAAFHAQQCGEKAVKALVESLHGSVRGHSAKEILRQLPTSRKVPPELLIAATELDSVYVTSRYPNGYPSGSPDEYFFEKDSTELISYARKLLDWCRSQIP